MSAAIAIAVALITAVVTAHLAFQRYQREKWLDRKLEKYCVLVSCMCEVVRICDSEINWMGLVSDRDIDSSESQSNVKEIKTALSELFRQADIAEMFVSTDFVDVMRHMESEIIKIDGSKIDGMYWGSLREAVDTAKSDLIELAKKDVNKRSLFLSA